MKCKQNKNILKFSLTVPQLRYEYITRADRGTEEITSQLVEYTDMYSDVQEVEFVINHDLRTAQVNLLYKEDL